MFPQTNQCSVWGHVLPEEVGFRRIVTKFKSGGKFYRFPGTR